MPADPPRQPASLPPRPLVLASRSPRRALLLRESGFDFITVDPPYADPADPNRHQRRSSASASALTGSELAIHLAQAKAESVEVSALPAGAVLLSADTLGVDHAGGLLGTPETAEAAAAMLGRLVGRRHRIVTGVALRVVEDGAAREHAAYAETATVQIAEMKDGQLLDYVSTGAWRGKAGGYNLAERLAAGWRIRVAGDPGTVMGLPMRRLKAELLELGVAGGPLLAGPVARESVGR